MAPQPDTKDLGVSAGIHKVTRTQTALPGRGTIKPNLVFIRDSGLKYVEFRVQCEVRITDQKAGNDIEARIGGNKEALKAALELVKKSIDPNASERFRSIVALGFEDQPGW